ncbi:MAG: hypothetical protein ACTSPY_12570 [Candidatus Helarchaeota archaeon]
MVIDEIQRIKILNSPQEVKILINKIFELIKSDPGSIKENLILRIFDNAIFNYNIIEKFQSKMVINNLLEELNKLDLTIFKNIYSGLISRVQGYLIKIVKNCLDIGHVQILELIEGIEPDPEKKYTIYFKLATFFNEILYNFERHSKFTNLERERIAKILADLHGNYLFKYSLDEKKRKFHLKFKESYENSILQFQRRDLEADLQKLEVFSSNIKIKMLESDFDREFVVLSPIRLGLSSANASDNHTRAKEKGSKALNAAINISLDPISKPKIPITVKVKRLDEQKLVLRSIDLNKDFILDKIDNSNVKLFFKYKLDDDELGILKHALVHVGIIKNNNQDPLIDIINFTHGGGLEINTEVGVFKGSGLGISSILSSAVLMCLYRISNQPKYLNYPMLYDQSLLLEQSIGLNSGWQDARGALGSKMSAVKHFITKPTSNLPSPTVEFIKVDEKEFENRIILYYTGMKRFATSNLNVVLDVYLSRDYIRYPSIQQSFLVHDQMVQSLKHNDYSEFGRLCNQYWNLRKTIDPSATNEKLEFLFKKVLKSNLSDGGLITGAGGGGFAVFIAKENKKHELIELLNNLNLEKNSFVVNYKLNKQGITLKEE